MYLHDDHATKDWSATIRSDLLVPEDASRDVADESDDRGDRKKLDEEKHVHASRRVSNGRR